MVLDETRREDNVGGERGGISVEGWQNRNRMLNKKKKRRRRENSQQEEWKMELNQKEGGSRMGETKRERKK